MKCITVPVNKDAMIRLDYDECIKGDLIELYLDSMDFDKLWASGVLKKLNDSLHIMIDDYESEEIIGNDNLLRAQQIVREIINQHHSQVLNKLLILIDQAIECKTGIFFFF